VLPLKDAAKNNAVEANVYIVRSFLENRSGKDKINIVSLLGTKTDAVSIKNVLTLIKNGKAAINGTGGIEGIGPDMNTTLSGSSSVKNPFNNAIKVDASTADVALNTNAVSASVIIGYDVNSIPTDTSSINSTVNTPGVTVVIVYQTGYVVYGVDNFGEIIQPTLINMPEKGARSPGNPDINPLTQQVVPPTFDYTFDRDGGKYTLSSMQDGAIIRYTIDGTKPDLSSSTSTLTYDDKFPILVNKTTIINAYATFGDSMDSDVVSTTFTPLITIPILTPSFSFSGDFGSGNIVPTGEVITFSIGVIPAVLDGEIEVTTDNGKIDIVDATNGIYTFTAPNENNKKCTIIATLTKQNEAIEDEQCVGQLELTTVDTP
jgi:hypothetical protein